jgi:hypothetical protein
MRIFTIALVLCLPVAACASADSKKHDDTQPQIVAFCENPETGEQVELTPDGSETCPEDFIAYDDLTPVYIERVEDIPPPKPLPNAAEKEGHAE